MGEEWKGEGSCGMYVCDVINDKPAITHKEVVCPDTMTSQQQCEFGYELSCDETQCCNKCTCGLLEFYYKY